MGFVSLPKVLQEILAKVSIIKSLYFACAQDFFQYYEFLVANY